MNFRRKFRDMRRIQDVVAGGKGRHVLLFSRSPQVSGVLVEFDVKENYNVEKAADKRIARDLRIAVLSFRFTVTHRWEHKQGVS